MKETEQGKAEQVITASQPLQIDESCVSLTDFYQSSQLRKVPKGLQRTAKYSRSQKSLPEIHPWPSTPHSTSTIHLIKATPAAENLAGFKSRGTCCRREILTPCLWDSFTQDTMSYWLSGRVEDKVWSGKTPLASLLEKGRYPGHSLRGTDCISADH